MALTAASQEGLFLQQLLSELQLLKPYSEETTKDSTSVAAHSECKTQHTAKTVTASTSEGTIPAKAINRGGVHSSSNCHHSAAHSSSLLHPAAHPLHLQRSTQPVPLQFTLYTDNVAAKAIAEQNAPSSRSKHVAVRCNFLRQLVEQQTVVLQYVPTYYQAADIFTKPLPYSSFAPAADRLLDGIGRDTTHTRGGDTRAASCPTENDRRD